jgi:hypothetical protein
MKTRSNFEDAGWDISGGTDTIWYQAYTAAVPEVPEVPGYWVEGGYDHLEGESVCVYADGIPLGNYTITDGDIAGLDEDAYTTIIIGINYYSVYESFPMIVRGKFGTSQGWRTSIRNATVDFYETLGCNVGVTQDASVDWRFSTDNFATRIDPTTEIKEAPFLWGVNREPVVYLWEWDPIPTTIRSMDTKLEVTIK